MATNDDDLDLLDIQSLEDLTQENLGMRVAINTLEAELDEANDRADLWRERYDNYECDCDDRSDEVEELQGQVDDLKEALDDKDAEIDRLKEEIEELQAQLPE